MLNLCFFATGNPTPLKVSEPFAISGLLWAVKFDTALIQAHKYSKDALILFEEPLLMLGSGNCLRLISILNVRMNRFIIERLLFLAKYCTQ